ncbi:MAG: TIR domain-containing protein [Candidatus Nomurabacteria bacterium]|nr:MAG: TIR domain-containing protein [Candidatus Nomurabacteria bacterium]
MTQFDELYKALYGANPPQKKPVPSASLSAFLRPVQPAPRVNTGFLGSQQKPLVKFRKPKVFVSFDYEHDRIYKQALDMWDANKRFDFTFQSHTPNEIQSFNVGRIKAVLTTKVKEATHVIVLVGKYANQVHPDTKLIGFRNWINFEVYQARLYKKKIICVMLDNNNTLPEWLVNSGATLVRSFNEKDIIEALKK